MKGNEDITKFTGIMAAMAENFPGAVLTSNGLKLRFAALEEFSIDQETHRWRYQAWASRVKEAELHWWFRDFVRVYKSQVAGVKAG